MGSKSENSNSYICIKMLTTPILGFVEKSQNIMGVSKKCVVMLTNLAGERFDSVFWKNKVDGTQNLTYNGKMMPKVLGPTNEKNAKLEKLIFDYIMIKIS